MPWPGLAFGARMFLFVARRPFNLSVLTHPSTGRTDAAVEAHETEAETRRARSSREEDLTSTALKLKNRHSRRVWGGWWGGEDEKTGLRQWISVAPPDGLTGRVSGRSLPPPSDRPFGCLDTSEAGPVFVYLFDGRGTFS